MLKIEISSTVSDVFPSAQLIHRGVNDIDVLANACRQVPMFDDDEECVSQRLETLAMENTLRIGSTSIPVCLQVAPNFFI